MSDTIESICEVCGKTYEDDGYKWTCDECRHPKDCTCGSDDVILDWHIVNDQNGDLCPNPMWSVECQKCERTTAYFETAKEARDAWMNNEAEKVMQ